MNVSKIFLGGVYKYELSKKLIRVVLFDKFSVHYEVWWDFVNDWSCRNNLNAKIVYYSLSVKHFETMTTFVKLEPLNELELSVHRPDLPLSVFESPLLDWKEESISSIRYLETELILKGISLQKDFVFKADEIYIVPFGPKGGVKKRVKIKNNEPLKFGQIEFLFTVINIQSQYTANFKGRGIKFYRAGIYKKIPVFNLYYYPEIVSVSQTLANV